MIDAAVAHMQLMSQLIEACSVVCFQARISNQLLHYRSAVQ
jgi:hypothetical protein